MIFIIISSIFLFSLFLLRLYGCYVQLKKENQTLSPTPRFKDLTDFKTLIH